MWALGMRLLLLAAWHVTVARGLCASPAPVPSRTVGSCKAVGVDFGLRCCGLAISSGFAPLPIAVLPCGGDSEADFEAVANAVARVAAGEGASQVVLGMPYNSSGGEGEQANATRAFAAKLADAVHPRPVFLWDERFSSAEASMRMNGGRGAARGERVDAVAAAIILEDFFRAEEHAFLAAPHVPASRPAVQAGGAGPRRPRPTPPSQSEIRRAMMQRVAEQQGRQQQQQQQQGRQRRKR